MFPFHRRSICLAVVWTFQFFSLFYCMDFMVALFPPMQWLFMLVSYGVVLSLLSSSQEPAFKIGWLLLILPFPLVGGSIFLLLRGKHPEEDTMSGILKQQLQQFFLCDKLPPLPYQPDAVAQLHYLQQHAHCAGFLGCKSTYLPTGVAFFAAMVEQIQIGKKYIFLEYFILSKGIFWNTILKLLQEKCNEGLIIRLLYDDAGSFFTLSQQYPHYLRSLGIQVQRFRPLYPVLSSKLNHRDHRKLLIIDGTVAFTGGMNLSDEYIHETQPFGYWKDSALLVEGKGAWAMTVMFLAMWEKCSGEPQSYPSFYPEKCPVFSEMSVVVPYTNVLSDSAPVGQATFLNMIARAKRYIHITTPYLILDTASQTALCNAARSGIEVSIITPAIPDKKLVFQVTRAFYPPLIEAGVKIYEFTPGFMHGKLVIVDGVFATVGTINLDFRSLFLHYENAVWLWCAPCLSGMEEDFQDAMAQSSLYQEEKNRLLNMVRSVLRVFAPFM